MNETQDDLNARDMDLRKMEKMLVLPSDGLVCSLNHEVVVTTMDEYVKSGASS